MVDVKQQALRALEGVTEGEWHFRTLENFGGNIVRYQGGDRFDLHRIAKAGSEDDARFIASSRQLVPGLVARIEALEAALTASARQHRIIAGMDLMGASSVAYNAAREAEAAIAAFDKGGKDDR